ncbi:unnamed protein product, partial [marine sediment metagenome]
IDRAIRIVVEHSRGIAFLIADGVLPSNEGRGYVLRRILRRASLFGRRLGLDKPFLSEITTATVSRMNQVYPELIVNRAMIDQITRAEEEKFIGTLESGLTLVEELIEETMRQEERFLPSEQVFRLYDTHGFPAELTAEIARERGISVDPEGFEAEMQKQREMARATQKLVSDVAHGRDAVKVEYKPEPTDFIGYDSLESRSKVSYLLDQDSGIAISQAKKGKLIAIVLDRTPFYAEMGGQVGDMGKITCPSGWADINKTIWSPFGNLA